MKDEVPSPSATNKETGLPAASSALKDNASFTSHDFDKYAITPGSGLPIGPGSPPTTAEMVKIYIWMILKGPFALAHYIFDVLLGIVPSMRPNPEWTFNQALRVRAVRLALPYISRLRLGHKTPLKPSWGRERKRWEVMQPAPAAAFDRPPFTDERERAKETNNTNTKNGPALFGPEPVGATWTPSLPPPAGDIKPTQTVALHFHGGAFVINTGRDKDSKFLGKTLHKHLGCAFVCLPQYRLCTTEPSRFPVPLYDAVTAYHWLIHTKKIPASQIILSGDSAGATLAFALARYLARYGAGLGLPFPAAMAVWSPWIDVSAGLYHDMTLTPQYKTDYLNRDFARWGADAVSGYGTIDPKGEWLSIIRHPFAPPGWETEGEPTGEKGTESASSTRPPKVPIFVQGSNGETLWEGIEATAERLKTEVPGWEVTLEGSPGPHDIILMGDIIAFEDEVRETAWRAREFFLAHSKLTLQGGPKKGASV
ncbi:Alpha/Beta hydrolase protein [Chaetomium sp. MPI-SDFR-AT-0129]|nr:Alpha/Beta hydrolase protein [Chaetomium sp. MPI-SDFR-AT-0129]